MARTKTKIISYLLVLTLAFLLLFVRSRVITAMKFTISGTASFPVRILAFPVNELKKILFYHRTFNEYMRLRREVGTLQARLVGMEEVIRENTRLEQLLAFKRQLIYSSISADVVGRDPSNWNASLTIDKGTKDGVAVGMPVVNAGGVVGKIAEVSAGSSKVILVSDPSFSVAALDVRSREVGLVAGTLEGLCRMKYLSAGADVVAGDKIITSKLSSSFPEGLMIGQVVQVHKSPDNPTINCLIRPAVALSQIEEVLVVQTAKVSPP